MRLKDKVALVSGAARSMGYEIVELFAREGAITYAGDIATPERPHSDGVGSVRLEVSRGEDWAGAVETILDKHCRIDVLVKNAGSIAHEPLGCPRSRGLAACLCRQPDRGVPGHAGSGPRRAQAEERLDRHFLLDLGQCRR